MRKVRCPKCGKPPISYRELWTGFSMSFDVEDDGEGTPEPEGILCEGYPCGVVATCDCKHSWRLRGVKQITELRAEGNGIPADGAETT
jgi:hypothetical protein